VLFFSRSPLMVLNGNSKSARRRDSITQNCLLNSFQRSKKEFSVYKRSDFLLGFIIKRLQLVLITTQDIILSPNYRKPIVYSRSFSVYYISCHNTHSSSDFCLHNPRSFTFVTFLKKNHVNSHLAFL
jgi:hypothetical protein